MTQPLQVSSTQLTAFRRAIPGESFRPVQPLHDRAPRFFAAAK